MMPNVSSRMTGAMIANSVSLAIARFGGMPSAVRVVLSWLALDREMLVVGEVQTGAEEALDERCDELEWHQQRDVDVTQPVKVVRRLGGHRAAGSAVVGRLA